MRAGPWPRTVGVVAAHPMTVDVLLASGLTVVSVLQGLDDRTGQWRPFDGLAIVLTALTTLPTAFRRRAPMTVLLVCCAFWICSIVLGYMPVLSSYAILLALYSVAVARPWPFTAAGLVIGGGIWVYAGVSTGTTSVVTVVLQAVVIPAVIWRIAAGSKELALRNRQLAEAAGERAQRAVADERLRIARELHDVVAHHMSVIAVQAGLARYVLRTDPDTAHSAIGTVLDTGAEALDELRRMLTLLRAGPGLEAPAPGLSSLPELFERVRAAGLPVELITSGTPRPVSSGVELCVYRVIQEGLTNVLRHAGPATAVVELRYSPRELMATVRDDGPARPPAAQGHGLIGMRERVNLYGGTVSAGPRPEGGYEVRLMIPLTS